MIAIAAMAQNRVIGHNGKIPWYLPEDFKHFKATTMGGILIMGRKTFESLPGVLPHREHWIISRTKTFDLPHVRTFKHPIDIPSDTRNQFVIGGEQIFKELLPKCTKVILSLVKLAPEGDTFFPYFEEDFTLAATEQRSGFDILNYERKKTMQTKKQPL